MPDPVTGAYRYLGTAHRPPVELANSVDLRGDGPDDDALPAGALPPPIIPGHPVVSLHDHPERLPRRVTPEQWEPWAADGRPYVGYAGLRRSGLSGVFFSRLGGEDMPSVLRWAGFLQADFAHGTAVRAGLTADDLTAAAETGAVAAYLSLEAATPMGTDLGNLEVMFGVGFRSMGICYDPGNALGCGLGVATDTGLTPLGAEAVRLMNALGILVDLAHVGDRTSLDAIERSRVPPVISHAGARALWPTVRMKPDDVLRALADAGGVIGIEAAPHSTMTDGKPHTLDSVMAHFAYCVDLIGIDHVGFGPDVMFGDHVGLHNLSPSRRTDPPHPHSEFVDGIENPGEAFHHIAHWMRSHGYAEEDVAKALGGNVVRVMRAAAIGAGTGTG